MACTTRLHCRSPLAPYHRRVLACPIGGRVRALPYLTQCAAAHGRGPGWTGRPHCPAGRSQCPSLHIPASGLQQSCRCHMVDAPGDGLRKTRHRTQLRTCHHAGRGQALLAASGAGIMLRAHLDGNLELIEAVSQRMQAASHVMHPTRHVRHALCIMQGVLQQSVSVPLNNLPSRYSNVTQRACMWAG